MLLFTFVSAALFAQTRGPISGVVTDAGGVGIGIIGAWVVVSGTTNGTITVDDGSFRLDNVAEGVQLEVSCVGHTTQSVVARSGMRIVLIEGESLDEVIFVAYGTAKKSSFTGSAAVVKSDQIEKISGVTDADEHDVMFWHRSGNGNSSVAAKWAYNKLKSYGDGTYKMGVKNPNANHSYGIDVPLMRGSEMLLIMAEAKTNPGAAGKYVGRTLCDGANVVLRTRLELVQAFLPKGF